MNNKTARLKRSVIVSAVMIAVLVLMLNSHNSNYEANHAFDGGLEAQAVVVSANRDNRCCVKVEFTDNNRNTRSSVVDKLSTQDVRQGQTLTISYVPENRFTVRAPGMVMSEDHYRAGLLFFRLLIGTFVVFGLFTGYRALNRTPEDDQSDREKLRESDFDSSYKLSNAYSRIIFQWLLVGPWVVLVNIILVLLVTEILPISENIGLALAWSWVILCVWATVSSVKPILFAAPLVASHKGVSLRGKAIVPWHEMEEISIFLAPTLRYREQTITLRIFLTDSAKTPSDRLMQRGLINHDRPMVQLPLYITTAAHEQHELIGALCHFGLDRIDPNAAEQLRSTCKSSGPIQHSDDSESEVERSDAAANSHYMSNGFHIGN